MSTTLVTEPEIKDAGHSTRQIKAGRTMKALVYHGPGKRAWEEKPRPTIKDASDAIVNITTTTICGTDLHILKGDVPSVTDGRILGHEGIGIVDEVGTGVSTFKKGDRVLISCVTSCGRTPILMFGSSQCTSIRRSRTRLPSIGIVE